MDGVVPTGAPDTRGALAPLLDLAAPRQGVVRLGEVRRGQSEERGKRAAEQSSGDRAPGARAGTEGLRERIEVVFVHVCSLTPFVISVTRDDRPLWQVVRSGPRGWCSRAPSVLRDA